MYDSVYMINYKERKQTRGGEKVTAKGQGRIFGLKELYCLMTVVVATQLYLSKLIELYTEMGEFTVCKLCLNLKKFFNIQ